MHVVTASGDPGWPGRRRVGDPLSPLLPGRRSVFREEWSDSVHAVCL